VERRGAALMLSFMVLLVLILILAQIRYSTATTARVARNEETLVMMDSAIESSLLQVFEDLKTDAESDSGSAAGGLAGAAEETAGEETGGDDSGPSDSKEDEWARPQRTEFSEVQLRILIQDEDSKFNLLSVLTPDEEEADKALDRLARVIEWSRKGTEAEIDAGTSRRMATAIHDYMRRRADQVLPRPELLSDDEDESDVGLPLSLREFVAVDTELFPADLFRDFHDENEDVVHSLGTFLTVWSSVGTAEEAEEQAQQESGETAEQDAPGDNEPDPEDAAAGDPPEDESGGGQDPSDESGGEESPEGQAGQGGAEEEPPPGWAINVNTAPGAVLHALMDSRDLPYRFWDDVVLYRNEKDESVEENEDPPLDEYGEPILVRQFFRSVEDLSKVDGWEGLEPIVQGEIKGLLKTESQVFSIFVTARKPTGEEQIDPFSRREDVEREEANWQGLVRTVRAVVWRRRVAEGEYEIVPLVRWEVLDYSPFEVLDFPDRRDYR
jgi:type II secretory pathway component PulK